MECGCYLDAMYAAASYAAASYAAAKAPTAAAPCLVQHEKDRDLKFELHFGGKLLTFSHY